MMVLLQRRKKLSKRYKLFLGDCLEVMPQLISKNLKVDAIITDPPYEKTHNKWDSLIPIDEMWVNLKSLIKDNGAIILFGQDKYTAKVMLSNEKEHRYNLIWNKGNRGSGHLNANRMPLRNHEDIMVFYKKLPTYNPQFTEGEPLHGKGTKFKTSFYNNNTYGKCEQSTDYRKGETKKYPKSILSFNKPHPAIHPTQKSIELMEWLIKTYTNEDEVVLDFTMGSGTTGVACMNLNRKFIGIEKEEKYFNIAKERIEKAEKEYSERTELM